jgi:hypothetical protein
MQETWAEAIVDRLAALKLAGMVFDDAWRWALAEHPPRGSEFRGMGPLTLLKPRGELDPVEFMRRACDDAWHGRRPQLAALSVDTVDRALLHARGRAIEPPLNANVG